MKNNGLLKAVLYCVLFNKIAYEQRAPPFVESFVRLRRTANSNNCVCVTQFMSSVHFMATFMLMLAMADTSKPLFTSQQLLRFA